MDNRSIKFIYEDENSRVIKEFKHGDIDLTQMCEEFTLFLKAMGYHFTGKLEFVEED